MWAAAVRASSEKYQACEGLRRLIFPPTPVPTKNISGAAAADCVRTRERCTQNLQLQRRGEGRWDTESVRVCLGLVGLSMCLNPRLNRCHQPAFRLEKKRRINVTWLLAVIRPGLFCLGHVQLHIEL